MYTKNTLERGRKIELNPMQEQYPIPLSSFENSPEEAVRFYSKEI